ncbi:MAG: hypothetical protein Q7S94_07535 [Gallionella sp.]|nr:hypothetical protein [Gallionella sp.]
MENSFQRIGEKANADVGRKFELCAQSYFAAQDVNLELNHKVRVGIEGGIKKFHAFDLGCNEKKILVECKSHRWTTGNNVPSAKLTVWNEAMYYFHLAPRNFRKIMFVLHHCNNQGKSLASYYWDKYKHLVPNDVELWEYDEQKKIAIQINPPH